MLPKFRSSSGFLVVVPLAFRSLFVKHPFFALSITELGRGTDVVVVQEFGYRKLRKTMRDFAVAGDFNQAVLSFYFLWSKYPLNVTSDFDSLAFWYSNSANLTSMRSLFHLYRVMKSSCPKPNMSVFFETLLAGMLVVGDVREFEFIVNEMCEFGFTPSFDLLNKLLQKVIKLNQIEDSLSILHAMMRFGYSPREFTYFSLIRMLCKYQMVHQAAAIFSALFHKGTVYGVYTLGPIVWALSQSGQSLTSLYLCYRMIMKGFVLNVCLYTSLIASFCREKNLTKAIWLFHDMRRHGEFPNVFTYTILIKYYSDCGKVDEALSLLVSMEQEGIFPDLVVVNILLRELCNQNRTSDAVTLFESMKQRGLCPDNYTVSAIGGGLLRGGRVEAAYRMTGRAVCDVTRVDVVVYNIFLRCLCCLKRSEEGLGVLERMERFGLRPSTVSYNTIVSGLCAERKVCEALRMLDWFDPNIVAFNAILTSACVERDWGMVDRILTRMEIEGTKLNEFGFMRLIEFCCSCGEMNKCRGLMEAMKRQCCPSVAVVNKVLGNLCRKGLVRAAKRISSGLRELDVGLDTTSYNILSNAAMKERDLYLVLDLVDEMLDQKVAPDGKTFTILISSFCLKGKISWAFQVMKMMQEEGRFISSTETYNVLIKTMIQKGRSLYALSLLQDMLIDGCTPNRSTWELISGDETKRWVKIFPEIVQILEHSYITICSVNFHDRLNCAYIIQRVID